jgi:hypothetical protein
MVKAELQNILIERIRQINDETFLEALKVLTEGQLEKENYQLSSFEKEKITQAREDGNYLEHQSVIEDINKWLEK